jgi:hypothetical protein
MTLNACGHLRSAHIRQADVQRLSNTNLRVLLRIILAARVLVGLKD